MLSFVSGAAINPLQPALIEYARDLLQRLGALFDIPHEFLSALDAGGRLFEFITIEVGPFDYHGCRHFDVALQCQGVACNEALVGTEITLQNWR